MSVLARYRGSAKFALSLAVSSCCHSPPTPEIVSAKVTSDGRSSHVQVLAKPYWNDTVIRLIKGKSYRFNVTGNWTDAFVPCGPIGPTSFLGRLAAEPFRNCLRYPVSKDSRAITFIPVAAIQRSGSIAPPPHSFLVIDNEILTAPATGYLSFFADDVPAAYSNNCGSVEITVTPVLP